MTLFRNPKSLLWILQQELRPRHFTDGAQERTHGERHQQKKSQQAYCPTEAGIFPRLFLDDAHNPSPMQKQVDRQYHQKSQRDPKVEVSPSLPRESPQDRNRPRGGAPSRSKPDQPAAARRQNESQYE